MIVRKTNKQTQLLKNSFLYLPSTFVLWPTVTSHPGKTLAASTGEIQHKPMGFFALWKASRVDFTSSLTTQAFPSTAHEHRFLATPKPPEKEYTEVIWTCSLMQPVSARRIFPLSQINASLVPCIDHILKIQGPYLYNLRYIFPPKPREGGRKDTNLAPTLGLWPL